MSVRPSPLKSADAMTLLTSGTFVVSRTVWIQSAMSSARDATAPSRVSSS